MPRVPGSALVVARKTFTRTDRLVAGVLAAACLTGGGAGLLIAIERSHVTLGILTLLVIAVGGLYGGAALRGRPWRWLGAGAQRRSNDKA
jgi:hypothetical protein